MPHRTCACGMTISGLSKHHVCPDCRERRRKRYDRARYANRPGPRLLRPIATPAVSDAPGPDGLSIDARFARAKAWIRYRHAIGQPVCALDPWEQVYHAPLADACEKGDAQQIRSAYKDANIPSDDTYWVRGRSAQNIAFYYCTRKDKA